MTENRAIDGDIEDQPYPLAQVVGKESLVDMESEFLAVNHWSEEYTGLEVHLDGPHDPLIVQGTKDANGNEATVGTWLSVKDTREFGEALIEAADRVEEAREQEAEPRRKKGNMLARAKKRLFSGESND
jgi:hypothetical protein